MKCYTQPYEQPYSINATLINVIEQLLCDRATSAVFSNDDTHGEWFDITVAVTQDCVPSLSLFNILPEMIDTLDEHEGTFSICSRAITKLHFAEDIDRLSGEAK